jgi:dGTPase
MAKSVKSAKTAKSKGHNSRQALWAQLLSSRRLYGQSYPLDEDSRSEYQRDYDRIIFLSAFRRLQDKTQVFPLSQTDYTRTRLTHTLETSSVARTLGILAGKHLVKLGVPCEPHDIGTIAATAALAHDLGNPPFGHSGEASIQSWARKRLPVSPSLVEPPASRLHVRLEDRKNIPMTPEEYADFHLFEGNAQGFRILVRTGARTRKGGLRPTMATLGTMAKYPRPSLAQGHDFDSTSAAEKKPGYFQNDRRSAVKAFRALGLVEKSAGVFSRHPLAFLLEAADDVTYAIADLEDGFKLGIVDFKDLSENLTALAAQDPTFKDMDYLPKVARLDRMRAHALRVLAMACMAAFRDRFDEIEQGKLGSSLLKCTPLLETYNALIALAREKVYRHERVLQIEYAGYQTIGGLLDMFHAALCTPEDLARNDKLMGLLPIAFLWRPGRKNQGDSRSLLEMLTPYERLLAVTDYVSGMTDRYAVQLYQRLSGIRLPD